MGDWHLVGDYGEMPHLFVCLHLFHTVLYSFCSVGKSVDVFALFMCVCVVNPEHTACLRMLLPQYQPPPAEVFAPTPHICCCVFAIAASCSQPPHFFLFYPWGAAPQNKGEKVAQFPPLESHTPREIFAPKHSQRSHGLALLSDLQRSWSGWLIHSHTAELFKLPRLEGDKSTKILLEIFRFLNVIPIFQVHSKCWEKDLKHSSHVKPICLTRSSSIGSSSGVQWWFLA